LNRRGLIHAGVVKSMIILFAGGAVMVLEPDRIHSFGDGIWWAVVTATTVGYGDIAPTTTLGRIIAVVLMLSGIGLMSTLAASITTYFISPAVEEKQDLKERQEIRSNSEAVDDDSKADYWQTEDQAASQTEDQAAS
jgi:voltage-gated potassium channel